MDFDQCLIFIVCLKLEEYLFVYTVKLPPVVTLEADNVAGDVRGILDNVGEADAVTVPLPVLVTTYAYILTVLVPSEL